jgi:hypothetical protein
MADIIEKQNVYSVEKGSEGSECYCRMEKMACFVVRNIRSVHNTNTNALAADDM